MTVWIYLRIILTPVPSPLGEGEVLLLKEKDIG